MRIRAVVLAGPIALAACQPAPMTIPPPPADFVRPEELPFGDTVASTEARALTRLDHALRPSFGQPHVVRYIAPPITDAGALRAYYAKTARGWSPLAVREAGDVESFGYSRDKAAFVVVLLPSHADDPHRFVTIVSYGASIPAAARQSRKG